MLWIKSQTIEINPIPQGYEIEIRTPFPSFNKLEKDSIPYFPNAGYLFQKGFPELQKLAVLLQTYSDLGFEIEILQDSSVEISASIAPSAGFIYQNQSEIIREKGAVYLINQYIPSSIYQLFDVADIGKEKKQSIWFHVLQYNPVIQKLKIHTYLKIAIILCLIIWLYSLLMIIIMANSMYIFDFYYLGRSIRLVFGSRRWSIHNYS